MTVEYQQIDRHQFNLIGNHLTGFIRTSKNIVTYIEYTFDGEIVDKECMALIDKLQTMINGLEKTVVTKENENFDLKNKLKQKFPIKYVKSKRDCIKFEKQISLLNTKLFDKTKAFSVLENKFKHALNIADSVNTHLKNETLELKKKTIGYINQIKLNEIKIKKDEQVKKTLQDTINMQIGELLTVKQQLSDKKEAEINRKKRKFQENEILNSKITVIFTPNKSIFKPKEKFNITFNYELSKNYPRISMEDHQSFRFTLNNTKFKNLVIRRGITSDPFIFETPGKYSILDPRNNKAVLKTFAIVSPKKIAKTVSIGLINDVNSITNIGDAIIQKLKRKNVEGKIFKGAGKDIDVFIFLYNSQFLPYEDIENSLEELKDLSKTGSVIVVQLIDDSVLENFLESSSKKLADGSDTYPSGIFLKNSSLTRLDNLFIPTKDNKIHTSKEYEEEVNDQMGNLIRYIKTVAENK